MGVPARNRTVRTVTFRRVLYQLSYLGAAARVRLSAAFHISDRPNVTNRKPDRYELLISN